MITENDNRPVVADRQITVGGKVYTLRASFAAIEGMQEYYGLPSLMELGPLLAAKLAAPGARDIVGMLWSTLRSHHPDVTVKGAAAILEQAGLHGLPLIMDEIRDAFAAASPETKPNDAADPQ